jgi:NADH-quinone oxidoreductase subunit G
MPRPQQHEIMFSLDGREVRAPENVMLADAAKYGDVEIPVFCYEPKLGQPVGACRMCLVEIEGIPKLQTACSTAVKDGMVVHTQTDRVRAAQQAVVEFLLINHPLDCPVCDKGGECPLQDITFGWGGGRSRFIEPKRHFRKPLELSPLIAIDRERCILCYRCVRFSQEVSEDYQLVLAERGNHTYVGTFDSHPYVAPFAGNIIELCPVGALTSRPYRFRARPWDVEGAGSICALCPAQCNVDFTVRDERVLRVLARENPEVDDGWLCDKGRFAYQAMHVDERVTQPLLRDGGELRPVSWERALAAAVSGLARAQARTGALVGGETSNEEGFLAQRLLREALGSPHIDSRAGGGPTRELTRALAAPALQATVPDLEFAHAVLVLDTEPVDDAPILDLRIRKGVRRQDVKLAVAGSRPSALDPTAELSLRYAPGAGAAFAAALATALGGGELDGPARAAGTDPAALRELAQLLRGAGDEVVVLYGERLLRDDDAARALLTLAARLGLADVSGAGLLGVPAEANGRGLREAGALPDGGPGFVAAPADGRDAAAIAAGLRDGELTALYLLHCDPLRSHPDRAGWDRALERAATVVAHASLLTDGLREHATVVFPAESYAEKEGTLTHPDGRIQRLRPAIGRQGDTRPGWAVIAELSRRLGTDLGVLTGPMASAQLFDAVPFYAQLTLEQIGARGIRWPEREQAATLGAVELGPFDVPPLPAAPSPNGALRLGTFRSIWAAPEVEVSPALKFLAPSQRAELNPSDAGRLGLANGDRIEVSGDGATIGAVVALRAAVPAGTVFLQEGTAIDAANALTTPLVQLRKRSGAGAAAMAAATATPVGEGGAG